MPFIKLQSSDQEIFDTDVHVAKRFGTIRLMLENDVIKENVDDVVPMPNVNSKILRMLLTWANYHKDDPYFSDDDEIEQMPNNETDKSKEKRLKDEKWNADFLNVDQGTLLELIVATTYWDIGDLRAVTCMAVANIIKGKSTDDFSSDEED